MSIRTGTLAASVMALLTAAGTLPTFAGGDGRDGAYGVDTGYAAARHEGPYVTGILGGALGSEVDFDNTFEVDLDSGLLFGATVGYDNLFAGSGGDVRVEAEFSHRSQDFDGIGGDVDLNALMGNIWYDFDMNGRLVPYAGGGLGIGFIDDDVDEESGFAYQFGGGVNYHMSQHLMFGLNYRYLLANFEVDDVPGDPEIDYFGHQLSASLGYKF